jgi:hypothetical protein
LVLCGRLSDRKDVHDVKDCECKNHIRQRESDEARRETKFRNSKDDVTDNERDIKEDKVNK